MENWSVNDINFQNIIREKRKSMEKSRIWRTVEKFFAIRFILRPTLGYFYQPQKFWCVYIFSSLSWLTSANALLNFYKESLKIFHDEMKEFLWTLLHWRNYELNFSTKLFNYFRNKAHERLKSTLSAFIISNEKVSIRPVESFSFQYK